MTYTPPTTTKDEKKASTKKSDTQISSIEFKAEGRKFDTGKLEYGLIPPVAQKEMVKVLTFGATKYERDNWKKVPDSKRRYFDAAMRHLWLWKEGEQNDSETNINHLAHALCCVSFLLEHDLIYSAKDDTIQK